MIKSLNHKPSMSKNMIYGVSNLVFGLTLYNIN